jgi:hypothetical protein
VSFAAPDLVLSSGAANLTPIRCSAAASSRGIVLCGGINGVLIDTPRRADKTDDYFVEPSRLQSTDIHHLI